VAPPAEPSDESLDDILSRAERHADAGGPKPPDEDA
jgi:hypothetical protein